MIIELFGPPAVGKTTFARALATRLQERGSEVELIASNRPSDTVGFESLSPIRQTAATITRIARPVTEMVAMAGSQLISSGEVAAVADLLRMLPPRSRLWSIRLRHYLERLFRTWRLASSKSHMVLFDQGFVQAIGSLALLSRMADVDRIERALKAVPKPDILVRLDAPQAVLEHRLRHRLRGKVDRLFELDLQTSLESVQIIAELQALLRDQGCRMVCVDCADKRSLADGLERIGHEVAASKLVGCV